MSSSSALIISITTGLVLSIVTAVVTVQLALRRFRAERLWERRVDAYQTVLEALHHWSRNCALEWRRQALWVENEPNEAEQRKISEAYAEVYKAIDLGSFLLSDEAATCLANLEKELKESRAMHEEDYLAYLGESENSVNDCLKSLRVIAKKDLKKLRI